MVTIYTTNSPRAGQNSKTGAPARMFRPATENKINLVSVALHYIADENSIVILHFDVDGYLASYAGVELTAKLDDSDKVSVFIPKMAMDLLCARWTEKPPMDYMDDSALNELLNV